MKVRLQARETAERRPVFAPTESKLLLRKRAGGGTPDPTGEYREKGLERRATQPVTPSIVHEALNSPGRPLDPTTRAFMEARFGHDFSKVRVHTGARAAQSARAVNALAYTVGRNIVFGAGQYSTETSSGRRLLAHELTHVVQQGERSFYSGVALAPNRPGDIYEQQANIIGAKVARGSHRALAITSDNQAGPTIRRLATGPGLGSGTPTPASSWTPDLFRIRFDGDPKRHLFCSGEATLSKTTIEPDCVPPVMMPKCPSYAVPALIFAVGGYVFTVRFYVDTPSTPYPSFLPPPTVSVNYYFLTRRGRRTFSTGFSDTGPFVDRLHPGTELTPAFGTSFSFDVERSGTLYIHAELRDKSGLRVIYNHRVDFVCPAPASAAAPTVASHGPTADLDLPRRLPYREAEELLECIRIMGEENAAACREQVLGGKEPE